MGLTETVCPSHMKLQRLLLHSVQRVSSTATACATFFTDFQSSDSVPTASVCDSDALKDVRRLRPSKSVGFDDT